MKTLFITGAAGYVGAMLCDQFSKREDVERIIALDKEPKPELLYGNDKIVWLENNTADGLWQNLARLYEPEAVIHTAWQIRELYGRQHVEWRWNVVGSRDVFEFAFSTPSVKKLIYFSTAAIYGADKTNSLSYRFVEYDPLREKEYSYGREKKKVEEVLLSMWEHASRVSEDVPQIFMVRPAAITGPRGRFMRIRFGLQSALTGKLRGNLFYTLISLMVSFVPATPWWARQFVHEDDVADIVSLFAFNESPGRYAVFNLAPPGEPVLAPEMARIVGKRRLFVAPWMVRLAFFVFWHLSRGKIPNGRGVWRFYSYPVLMDGSKLTKYCGYEYKYSSVDAFEYTNGRYESFVPEEERKTPTKTLTNN